MPCVEIIEAVKEFEGYRQRQYLCPTGHPTIGYGHLIRRGEAFDPVKGISRDVAERLLIVDLTLAEGFVDALVKVPLTECMRGALASFVFNVGPGNVEKAGPGGGHCTLLRLLNQGDYRGAAGQFERWVYGRVNGQKVVLPGLVKRRVRERDFFERGIPDAMARYVEENR